MRRRLTFFLTAFLAMAWVAADAQTPIYYHYWDSVYLSYTWHSNNLHIPLDFDDDGTVDAGFRIFPTNHYNDPKTMRMSAWSSDWKKTAAFTDQKEAIDQIPEERWKDRLEWHQFSNWGHPNDSITDFCKYIAVRKPVEEGYCYGWIRLNRVEWDTIYGSDYPYSADYVIRMHVGIHDFAYCTVPNYSLMVGQYNYIGVDETGQTSFVVRPNPTNGSVRIDGVDAAQVEVYNSMGQLVKTFHNSNELHLEGLAKGLYLLRITDKNGETTTTALVRK